MINRLSALFLFLGWCLGIAYLYQPLVLQGITGLFSALPAAAWGLMGIGGLLILLASLPQTSQLIFNRNFSTENRRPLILAALIPLALFWLLYHPALNNGFMNDDPCHLYTIKQLGIIDGFFKPGHSISPVNFTPLFTASFGGDFYLFGLEPQYYYWHHLLSFSLSLVLLFFALSYFLPPLATSLVLSAFVASVPSTEGANFLMERHYIEGLGLAAAAFILFVQAVRNQSYLWAILGAGLYLLAALSKELYVPLVGLLPFIAVGTARIRWRMWTPYLLGAGIYIIWRWYMLGGEHVISGYGKSLYPDLQDILSFPTRYIALMHWPDLHLIMLFFGLGLFLTLLLIRIKTRLLNTVLWAGAAIIPIIPVLKLLLSRFTIILTLFIYIAVGLGLYYRGGLKKPLFYTGFFLLLIISGLQAVRIYDVYGLQPLQRRIQEESNFMLYSQDRQAVLISELRNEIMGHCLWAYQPIRQEILQVPQGPGVASSLCEALVLYPDRRKYFRYNNEKIEPYLQNIQNADDFIRQCEKIRALSVGVLYHTDRRETSWELGPYSAAQGRYYSVIGHSPFSEIPATGNTNKLNLTEPLTFYIRYIDKSGWQTTSPPLLLEPKQAETNGIIRFYWQRNDE